MRAFRTLALILFVAAQSAGCERIHGIVDQGAELVLADEADSAVMSTAPLKPQLVSYSGARSIAAKPAIVRISTLEIKPANWQLICENDRFALFCGNGKDAFQKRCASKQDGKFLYTFGRHCVSMACYMQNCQLQEARLAK